MVRTSINSSCGYSNFFFLSVLTSDYAVLLAEEFGRNPIVNDEAAFDIYPLCVLNQPLNSSISLNRL